MQAAAATMAGFSEEAELERRHQHCQITPGQWPDPGTAGAEQGCSAHVAESDSCHPKNSKWHHPSLGRTAVLADSGTDRARAGAIEANTGLAATAVPWSGRLWRRSHSQRVPTLRDKCSPPAGKQVKPKPTLPLRTNVMHRHPEHLHLFCRLTPRCL